MAFQYNQRGNRILIRERIFHHHPKACAVRKSYFDLDTSIVGVENEECASVHARKGLLWSRGACERGEGGTKTLGTAILLTIAFIATAHYTRLMLIPSLHDTPVPSSATVRSHLTNI